jgi:predicted DNA-binding transcriptional regulator AlpA
VGVVPEPDPNTDWWTTTDVANYLGVTVSTVSSYRARGQMPPPDRTIGRTHVWTPNRIIEWHDQRPGHGGRPPNRPRSPSAG